jgi:hypothetical protein
MSTRNKTLTELLLDSSIANLLNPIRAKRLPVKILWIIFLFGFLFGSIYYVVLNIKDYLKYDTTTSIYEINEHEAEFLTISFCNSNSIRNYLTDFKLDSAYFNNEQIYWEWIDHFENYTDLIYDECYRFNSGKDMQGKSIPIKKSKFSGIEDGLIFRFQVSNKIKSIRIHFHNHSRIPIGTLLNKGILISSGFDSYISVKRIFDQKLAYPYNDCQMLPMTANNETIINYLKSINYEYSQKECVNQCRNLKYYEDDPCNCSTDLWELAHVKCYYNMNLTIYDNEDKKREVQSCLDDYMASLDLQKCMSEYCPLECESVYYEMNHYEKLLDDYFDKNFSWFEIKVFYEDLKYTLIGQQPKIEFFGLVSNVGGIFGFFLGCSFLAILELVLVCLEFICNHFSHVLT